MSPPIPRAARPARRLLLACLALLAGAACSRSPQGDGPPGPPAEPPYIQGVITALERDGVRIEERPGDRSGSAKAVLSLTPQTLLLHRSGGAALPTELREGIQVSAWVEGPLLESYPVQGTARAIVLEAGEP